MKQIYVCAGACKYVNVKCRFFQLISFFHWIFWTNCGLDDLGRIFMEPHWYSSVILFCTFRFLVPASIWSHLWTTPTGRTHSQLLHDRIYSTKDANYATDISFGRRYLFRWRRTGRFEGFFANVAQSHAWKCSRRIDNVRTNGPNTWTWLVIYQIVFLCS